MRENCSSILIGTLVTASIALPVAAQKKAKITKWDLFPGGWTQKNKVGTFHTTLDKKELPEIAARIAQLLPAYEKEGKSYLTISVGCRGGRHRSVAIAEELHALLRTRQVSLSKSHRDCDQHPV